jgi:hypothetical protein
MTGIIPLNTCQCRHMTSIMSYEWYISGMGLSFISNRQRQKEGTFCASELAGIEPTPSHSSNLSATANMVYIWHIPGSFYIMESSLSFVLGFLARHHACLMHCLPTCQIRVSVMDRSRQCPLLRQESETQRGFIPEASEETPQAFRCSEMKLYKHATAYKWTADKLIATIILIKSTDFKVKVSKMSMSIYKIA